MKGTVSSVMCIETVKSTMVPLSVVDLLMSDAQSRLNMSFMNLRNVSTFFTFVLKSPQKIIGTSVSTFMMEFTYWLLSVNMWYQR